MPGVSEVPALRGLHHRPDAPGHEFLVAEALGAGTAARGYFDDEVEYFAADLLHGALAIGDGSGVDVHVIRHAAVGIAVGRDFDDGDGGESDGASATRGKGDQI